MKARVRFAILFFCVFFPPAHSQQWNADEWRAKLREIRQNQEQRINGILDHLISDLAPNERSKVDGNIRARLGWSYPNASIDCSVGNTALLRILPGRYEIWICEEGLRAIADAAAAATFLDNGRPESRQRMRRASEYFFKRYIYEVAQSAMNMGWAAVSCLPYQVAYLAATTDEDPIRCDRKTAHSPSDPDAVWALSAATSSATRLFQTMPEAIRPSPVTPTEPVDFNLITMHMRDFLVEYMLLHELAHVVEPAAQVTDLQGCASSSTGAEVAADAFALNPRFGGMKLKPSMMWWQATAWSYLDYVGALNPSTKCQLIKRDAGVRQSFCASDRKLTDAKAKDPADSWLEGLRSKLCDGERTGR